MSDAFQLKRIAGPEVNRLADMKGVILDLKWVSTFCARFVGRFQLRSPDFMEAEAFQAAAVIRYGRCCKGGRRTNFTITSHWIAKLSPDFQDAHAYFIALRDKHIAHSVNDWELNIPFVRVVGVAKNAPAITGVEVASHRIALMSVDRFQQLGALAKALADAIQPAFECERAHVLELIKRRPMQELLAAPNVAESIPGRQNIDDARGSP